MLARPDRTQGLLGGATWIAALMAARLGVDPHVLQTELDDEVRAHLSALANARQTTGAPLQ